MARTVRVVDSPAYARMDRIRPDVEVVETDGSGLYGRRWAGRGSFVFVLILALVAVWLYRNRGVEVFGRPISVEAPTTVNPPPVEIKTAPVIPPLLTVEQQPGITVEQQPEITAEQQSDITGYSRVAAERLNLRERPGFQYRVISILPRNWEVAILRQLHITPDGEVWVEVMAPTNQGWLKGWVIQRYLDSCDCPVY